MRFGTKSQARGGVVQKASRKKSSQKHWPWCDETNAEYWSLYPLGYQRCQFLKLFALYVLSSTTFRRLNVERTKGWVHVDGPYVREDPSSWQWIPGHECPHKSKALCKTETEGRRLCATSAFANRSNAEGEKKFIHKLVIKVRVIDMHMVWWYSDDRRSYCTSWAKSRNGKNTLRSKGLTVFLVELWILVGVRSTADDIIVKLIPSCGCSKFWARDLAQWVKVKVLYKNEEKGYEEHDKARR